MARVLVPVLLVLVPGAVALAAETSVASPAALWIERMAEVRDWKQWIATAATALLAAGWLLRLAGHGARLAKTRDVLLAALALATLFAWWHPYRGSLRAWLHVGDSFHYYMGSKYFEELGYTRLYDCAVIADAEAGLRSRLEHTEIRNLETNQIESASRVLETPWACKRHFTPERWRAFSEDLRFFRRRLTLPLWFKLRVDHGYNPPPTWTMVGLLLTGKGPPGRIRFFLLTAIDPLLLAAMFAALAWAFGWRVLCIAFIYWGTNQAASWEWVGGSILRFDWLAAAVGALCCWKRGRPVAAGLLLAWSVGVRIFPIAIVAGIALATLLRMFRERSAAPTPSERRFAVAFVAGIAVILSLSSLVVGPQSWLGFVRNSRLHLATDSVNRTGLRPLLAYRFETRLAMTIDDRALDPFARWKRIRAETFAHRRPLFAVVATAFVALLLLALRGQPPWVAGVLGIGMLPSLVELGGYYFGVLLAYACLVERREDVGVALMLLSAVSWWVGRFGGPDRDVVVAHTTLAMLLFVGYATLRMIGTGLPADATRPHARAPRAPSESPGGCAGAP